MLVCYNMLTMVNLTPQQQLFCKYYTTKGDTFGNNTLSYALAYDYELPTDEKGKIIVDCKEYNTCKANGSRLHLNDNVRLQIRDNMLALLNDADIDARVSEIAQIGKDTDAIQAIKIHNDLKNRITKHIDLTSNSRPLASLTDDELKAVAE